MCYNPEGRIYISFPTTFKQYEEYGKSFIDMLDGMFSFVLLDTRDKSFIVARDAIGITSLYIGWGLDGKCLIQLRFLVLLTIFLLGKMETQYLSLLIPFLHNFSGSIWISSELKGLNDDCEHFECFPPGHMYSSKEGGLRRWYNPPWFSEAVPSTPYDPIVLRRALENVQFFHSFSQLEIVMYVPLNRATCEAID